MALNPYDDSMTSTGKMGKDRRIAMMGQSSNMNKLAKYNLLKDVNRMQNGQLGMTQAEQRQLAENATQQAGAGIEAQNRQIAQEGLAAGSGAGPSARYSALQRSLGQNVAGAQAQAQTEAARISAAKTLSEKQDIDQRLAQQQAAQTQKNQYWAGVVMGGASSLMGSGAAAGKTMTG